MPGLEQLKKFSEDIQNIGNEIKIRRDRGESGNYFAIPSGVTSPEGKDDDSEDYINGLPGQQSKAQTPVEEEPKIEDFEISDDAELPDFNFTPPGTLPREKTKQGLDLGNLEDDDGPLPGTPEPPEEPDAKETDPAEEEEIETTPIPDLDIASKFVDMDSFKIPDVRQTRAWERHLPKMSC